MDDTIWADDVWAEGVWAVGVWAERHEPPPEPAGNSEDGALVMLTTAARADARRVTARLVSVIR